MPGLLRGSADDWRRILSDPAAVQRPDEGTWSPLEYAAHVRDLCRVYRARLNLMLVR
ncbi:hypothetical protein ABIB35_001812 [Arthrobacter sp. UYP6]|uniref:hypothetical protein n=1 Tax=Arthrobacter sp. UYP6 TaxID=1756378 RepID=UPI0033979897